MNVLVEPVDTDTELPPLSIFRFSEEQYRRMIVEGILGADEPVELRDGLLVMKGDCHLAPAILVCDRDGNPVSPRPLRVRPFRSHEYHQMIQAGILTEEDQAEFLEGWLVRKMSRKPPHDVVIALLLRAIFVRLSAAWHCRIQSAVVADQTEPEPDFAVVRGPERDYLRRHPRPRDTALAIEVAETSLRSDRRLKGHMYARVGIPIYWIVNLPDNVIEVYSDPTGPDPEPGYQKRQYHGPDDEVPLILDGTEIARIAVRDLLP